VKKSDRLTFYSYMKNNNSNILNWQDYKEWVVLFSEFILTKFPNISKEIKENKNQIQYVDYSGPLEKYINSHFNDPIFLDEFVCNLKSHYKYILAYHGCRPTNISSYYQSGLLMLDKKKYNELFMRIFNKNDFKEISQEHLEEAIQEMNNSQREDQLYLTIDDRGLLEDAGHYMIYGSEYIMSLTASLSGILNYDYIPYLRNIGNPTIFKIKIPLSIIQTSDLQELLPCFFRQWVYNKSRGIVTTHPLDFSFLLKENILPENIIEHYHPKEIRDYHQRGQIYIVDKKSYKHDKSSAY